jgi:phytoene/squalene synthetase
MNSSAALAHRITWKSSKQSYLTALLLADSRLVNDCLRAYAYFRWADDVVDLSTLSKEGKAAFISMQKTLVEEMYAGRRPEHLCAQEAMLADLIAHDRGNNSGLRSFIRNFMAVIEFDSDRIGCLVSSDELRAYTTRLATAVMDGIQYFIGNGHSYPRDPDRIRAVLGAHVVHMLRDMHEDIPAGMINLPRELLEAYDLSVEDLHGLAFRDWVRGQVENARRDFQAGLKYIEALQVLRCRLAGIWYLARFECVLRAIEKDGYILRRDYPERRCFAAWLEMLRLGALVVVKYFVEKVHGIFPLEENSWDVSQNTGVSSYFSGK